MMHEDREDENENSREKEQYEELMGYGKSKLPNYILKSLIAEGILEYTNLYKWSKQKGL